MLQKGQPMSELVLTCGQIPAASQVTDPDGSVSYVAQPVVIPCSWDASTLYLSSGPTTPARVRVDVRTSPAGIWSQAGGSGGIDGILVSPTDTNHQDIGPAINANTWVVTRIPNGPGDTMQGPLGYQLRQTVNP